LRCRSADFGLLAGEMTGVGGAIHAFVLAIDITALRNPPVKCRDHMNLPGLEG